MTKNDTCEEMWCTQHRYHHTNIVMEERVALELRIQEQGRRLETLGSDEKRVRKRIMQSLGKLKKQLATMADPGELSLSQAPVIDAEESTKTLTKKHLKLKLKIANSDIAEMAQKKQLKLARKKFSWCIKKGLTPGKLKLQSLLVWHHHPPCRCSYLYKSFECKC
jgi:hypothetical protein